MSIINERLQKYSIKTPEDKNHALKEILQEIILYALSEAGFFKEAILQGGTSLRIFYNLARFSEDLDFILRKPNPHFKWQPFLRVIEEVCQQYGISLEIKDKKNNGNIQKMIRKDTSIVNLLNLTFHRSFKQRLVIKLEIDVNPPANSGYEIKFLDFPLACEAVVQDLPSNFAGKSHALLCRKYEKGRDWYDFLWYVSKQVPVNFIFLSNALNQNGPWATQKINVNPKWYINALSEKIKQIDWLKTANDVAAFLNDQDRKMLKLWSTDYFISKVEKLKNTLDVFFINENKVNNLIEFLGYINKIKNETELKNLIKIYLEDVHTNFLYRGYKIEKITVRCEKFSNAEIDISISGTEKSYRIDIDKELLFNNMLKKKLQDCINLNVWQDLLEVRHIKISTE